MKKIVKIQIVEPKENIIIDAANSAFQYMDIEELINNMLPYTTLFKHITIKNFTTLPFALMQRLTNQYLHGAEITFETPTRKFSKTYKIPHSNPFYAYKFYELNLNEPMPKSLAEFKFKYNGQETTYLNALKTLNSVRYLPNDIYRALDDYSQEQIKKCREYNRGDYSYAEQWFKDLMKDCMRHNIKMFSPNPKTYYEAIAEIKFDEECEECRLKDGMKPLTQEQLDFLHKYAPMYDVEIPTFKYRYATRKTPYGYTQEIERCHCGMSNTDWSKVIYDPRNKDNTLPRNIRDGLRIRELENDKLLIDAYNQLQWLMREMGDEALNPNYKRCPHCKQLYNIHQGCECGAIPPLEFVNAENLFFSNASDYEDFNAMRETYDDMNNFELEIEGLDE